MATHDSTRRRISNGYLRGPGDTGSTPGAQEIPDKLYFRIGEVAALCDVPTHVLRFWEGEFRQLRPNKGGTGQRLYRRRDVEMALRIKTLLYEHGYTIPGARQAFKQELRAGKTSQLAFGLEDQPLPGDVKQLRALHKQLQQLHDLLSLPVAPRTRNHRDVQSIRRSDDSAYSPSALVTPAASGANSQEQPETLFDQLDQNV